MTTFTTDRLGRSITNRSAVNLNNSICDKLSVFHSHRRCWRRLQKYSGDKISTDKIAILIYTLYIIYNVKRTSAENRQRSLAVSDLRLTLCRYIYILYTLQFTVAWIWPCRPICKTSENGLERIRITNRRTLIFQKRTVIYRRVSHLCPRLHRRKTHEKF